MKYTCVFLFFAVVVPFSSAQLDLSFIDPLYYLYNIQHNLPFNALQNNINNNNNNVLDDIYQPHLMGCISNGNNIQGTCMQSHECKYSRGANFGRGNCTYLQSCCTYTKTCNDTVRGRVVYFQSPADPRFEPSPCTLRLQLLNEDICQIRVDVIQINLGIDPNNPQQCLESISVDPIPTENIPNICGGNTNNHFYIHLNRNAVRGGYVNMNVRLQQFSQNLISSSTWNMRLTQLECPGRNIKKPALNHKKRNENQAADDMGEIAPAGCAQYNTQPTGLVKLFGEEGSIVGSNNYAVCFKRFPNTCGVRFTLPPEVDELTCNAMITMITPMFPDEFCTTGTYILTHPGPLYIEINTDTGSASVRSFLEYAMTSNC